MEARRSPQPARQEIRLAVPCDPEWAALLRLAVAGMAAYFDFSTSTIEDLKLAVTEAYRHALATARGASGIEFTFDVSASRVSIAVDAGVPRELAADEADVSLFVLRAIADDVTLGSPERYHLAVTKAID
jgi:anti-sigma regulatory factor (Ser/Thr protein kinase)